MALPRTDPAWLAAQARYVADADSGESGDDVYARRVKAAHEMWSIETGRRRARWGKARLREALAAVRGSTRR